MNRNLRIVIALLLAILALAGCGATSLNTTTLSEIYPGKIDRVSRIDIINGETGEKRQIADKVKIAEWIDQARNLSFVPDPDQEERDGFLYSVSLYEGDKKTLSFTPNYVGGHYYLVKQETVDLIQLLFDHPSQ